MFKRYHGANICYAYLADVEITADLQLNPFFNLPALFASSR